jgi:hypothetical protein
LIWRLDWAVWIDHFWLKINNRAQSTQSSCDLQSALVNFKLSSDSLTRHVYVITRKCAIEDFKCASYNSSFLVCKFHYLMRRNTHAIIIVMQIVRGGFKLIVPTNWKRNKKYNLNSDSPTTCFSRSTSNFTQSVF